MCRRLIPRTLVLFAAAAYFLPACGGKQDAEYFGPKGQLREIHDLYNMHVSDKKRPPARVEDLAPYEPGAPVGYRALQAGQCVVNWKAARAAGANDAATVLAYEKDVPAQGGFVVMKDGQIKKMTAEEFNASPKG